MQNNLGSNQEQLNVDYPSVEMSKGPFIITTYNAKHIKTTELKPSNENPMIESFHFGKNIYSENPTPSYSHPNSSFPAPLYIPSFLLVNSSFGKLPMIYNPHFAPQPELISLTPFISEPEQISNPCIQQPGLCTNSNPSLPQNQRPSGNRKGILSGKAYVSRNVYKSIVRFLFICVQKNREGVTQILEDAGFTNEEIEKCFKKLKGYNESVKAQNSKKNSQALIRKIVKESSARTYVLRETLYAMLKNSRVGKLGRISERNKEVYDDVCKYYYNEIVKSIGQSAQSNSFLL